ncbi:zinc ribbon domain-containing protein [Tenuibacillus multivorans]|nr:zinc ribbon domain-containing protein [Tenuibacillus multivorans]
MASPCYQNRNVKHLAIREWTCPECGVHHDRDIDASQNIRHEALQSAN